MTFPSLVQFHFHHQQTLLQIFMQALKKLKSVNITQQKICRVISQQMLHFSQHFADKFCL